MTKEFFPWNTADFISVVPRKFGAGMNVGMGKESNPRQTQIVSIDENILDENVRLTRVLNIGKNNFFLRFYAITFVEYR